MEGSPYRKFSISRRKGADPGTRPGKLHSGEPGFLLAGILGTGVPSSGDPETGVLPGVRRNSIPEYFSPTVCLLLLDFIIEFGEEPVHSSQPELLILSRLPLGKTSLQKSHDPGFH
ncbi:hypothetical protein Bca4012_043957 [Brassica carinata]